MFDSLKSKLKNILSKSPSKLDAEKVYEDIPEEDIPEEETPQESEEEELPEEDFPEDEEDFPEEDEEEEDEPAPEPKKEKKPAPKEAPKPKKEKKPAPAKVEKAPEPKKEEPPVSRKEWLKRNKQKPADKKESGSGVGGMVGGSGKKIKEDPLDDMLDELEVILLESDVAYPVVQDIILGVRDNLVNKKYARQFTLEEVVETAVKESVRNVLKVNVFDFDKWIATQERPTVLMFVGINGTGKTTTIAKIAKRLSDQNKSVVIAACDTFRAGAIEQLSIHADRLGVKIVKQKQDADPSAVAFDAIEHAKSKRKDVVLLDTAGRMQTNNNLIDEMKKIARIAKPALKIFVGDALAGNDAIEQAKVFDDAIGIDAIVLTKIDTDAKGGAALSIAHTIGKPIAFVSDGQGYDDLQVFDSEWMLERLFEE